MIRITVREPLVQGTTTIKGMERPHQYSHVIKTVGGYWSATFAHAANTATMDDWIVNGIGRHIEVHDETLDKCWEGIVNQIDAVYGNLTVTVGPLLDTTNRLDVSYSTVDVSVIPPTEGIQANVSDAIGWANDLVSQALHGVLPNVLSVGETNLADATAIRDTYLAQHSNPATTQVLNTGGAATPNLTIHCLGYAHWLFYVYNQLVNVGTINTDAKIVDVLTGTDAATGNLYNLNDGWLPFDATNVDTPAAPAAVPRYEYEDRTAWELIQGLAARGDTNQNRWMFGVYNDREAWYQQAPTTVEYTMTLSDPAQRIFGPTEVKPWRVLPGRWLRFSDFLASLPADLTVQEDPRIMFIESVTYTMPNTVTISGDPADQLSEVMASFGLGGIGV